MRKGKFSEERIISILAEQERGMSTTDVCRRHGVSSATFCKLKAKFRGMDGEAEAAIEIVRISPTDCSARFRRDG